MNRQLPLAVGLFLDPRGSDGGVVMGGRVAIDDFINAIVRWGRVDRLDLLQLPGAEVPDRDGMSRDVEGRPGEGPPVRVVRPEQLLRASGDTGMTVWYDPDDSPRAFGLRRLPGAGDGPITLMNHCASYENYKHTLFLRILLADTRPFDSVICTTQHARTAFGYILEHVRSEFNGFRGTDLRYRGRLDVIPYGIDTDLFRPRDGADARRGLGLPETSTVLLWVGRQSATDKADLIPLVRAVSELVPEVAPRDLRLVLAGGFRNGPLEKTYRENLNDAIRGLGLADRVLIVPVLPPDRRHLIYAAADIFVSPIDNPQETFGLTVLEAMACGIPQVVADWDGYKETVSHGETGFLVPTLWSRCDADLAALAGILGSKYTHYATAQSVAVDPAALKEAIRSLVVDDSRRRAMAIRSRQRAVAYFDWRPILRRFEELWAELAMEARAVPPGTYRRSSHRCETLPLSSAFGHYATALLADETVLVLSDFGRQVLNGRQEMPACLEALGIHSGAVLQEALRQLASREATGTVHFGLLARILCDQYHCNGDFVKRQLLWLIKYDLVCLGSRDAVNPR